MEQRRKRWVDRKGAEASILAPVWVFVLDSLYGAINFIRGQDLTLLPPSLSLSLYIYILSLYSISRKERMVTYVTAVKIEWSAAHLATQRVTNVPTTPAQSLSSTGDNMSDPEIGVQHQGTSLDGTPSLDKVTGKVGCVAPQFFIDHSAPQLSHDMD